MNKYLAFASLMALLTSCQMSGRDRLSNPTRMMRSASTRKTPDVSGKSRVEFKLVTRHVEGDGRYAQILGQIREGDLIAFKMTGRQMKEKMLRGNLRPILYKVLYYGHLAILVRDPAHPDRLSLLTSSGRRGANTRDGTAELEHKSFDVYRISSNKKLDVNRLREFAVIASGKSNMWSFGNFVSFFGIWTHNLEPETPDGVGDDYVCSTVVAAALHYSGLDLDDFDDNEFFEIVSPMRVLRSRGYLKPDTL